MTIFATGKTLLGKLIFVVVIGRFEDLVELAGTAAEEQTGQQANANIYRFLHVLVILDMQK